MNSWSWNCTVIENSLHAVKCFWCCSREVLNKITDAIKFIFKFNIGPQVRLQFWLEISTKNIGGIVSKFCTYSIALYTLLCTLARTIWLVYLCRKEKFVNILRLGLVGGMVLHKGEIAEMRTGEGKTLVAVLPAYLNALSGKGVHVVTVNDYLARRDCEWVGQVPRFLGLKVGLIQRMSRISFLPSPLYVCILSIYIYIHPMLVSRGLGFGCRSAG